MGRVGRAEGIDEISKTAEEVKDRETRGHGDELLHQHPSNGATVCTKRLFSLRGTNEEEKKDCHSYRWG